MKIIRNIGILLLAVLLAGCSMEKPAGGEDGVYYVNYETSVIEKEEYQFQAKDTDGKVQEIIQALSSVPEGGNRILPEAIVILGYEIQGDILNVDFGNSYRKQQSVDEILWRAAIVKNFLQIPGIGYVKFTVQGEDLLDSRENVVGLMSSYSFLENSGKDITAYQYTDLELYFADKEGNKLVPERRKVYYSSNSSVEKVVVEQLIRGPRDLSHQATISSRTRILNVSVSDRIAYVNLDQRFVTEALPIKEELPVYSIVNSLISLGTVDKVQISINGDTKLTFRDKVQLDQLFERDMSYCE